MSLTLVQLIVLWLWTTQSCAMVSHPAPCQPYFSRMNQHMVPREVVPETTNWKFICMVSVAGRNEKTRRSCQFDIVWYKDGNELLFDENGLLMNSSLSLMVRRGPQGRYLRMSRVLPAMSGNYTCRVAGSGVKQGPCRDLSCYPPESMSFRQLVVLDRETMQPSTAFLLDRYPPTPTDMLPDKPYLSRAKDIQRVLLGYGSFQHESFNCLFVVRPSGEEVKPKVTWYHSTPLTGQYQIPESGSEVKYEIGEPRRYPCRSRDFGVAVLPDAWGATVVCYNATMQTGIVNRRSRGEYQCTAVYGNNSLDIPFYLGYTKNLLSRENPADISEPLAVVKFNKNSSICLGAQFTFDCEVTPVWSDVAIAKVANAQYNEWGELIGYGNFTRIGWNGGFTLNSTTPWPASNVRIENDGLRLRMIVTIQAASQVHDGDFVCAAFSKYQNDRPTLEHMRLEVRGDCATGGLASTGVAEPDLTAVYAVIGGVGGLVVAIVATVLIASVYLASRRSAPIMKRLRVVCVDNAENYQRHRRRTRADGNTLSESQLLEEGGGAGGNGGSGGSTSGASTVSPEPQRSLRVPEVRVERIGAQRARWGFGSRRAGLAGGGAEISEANREIRYAIPSCPVLEVDRKFVRMYRLLGEGAFGSVHSGQLVLGCRPKDVAVKMLKKDYTEEELLALYKEMEIMKLMRQRPHPNIIKLIGICTKNGPFLLLVELAHHGNLRDFLKDRYLAEKVKAQYQNLRPGTKQMLYLPCVSMRVLLQFSRDVACALDFMASIKIVHRDVAARNILVANCDLQDGTLVAKVADFGLTRNVQDKDYYRVINEGKLPVKWLAPECLKSRIFSTESDVWAYGILLYEIFSFGELPYPGVSPSDIVAWLDAGLLNSRPPYASAEMYGLMRACWSWDPKQRPTFKGILAQLDSWLLEAAAGEASDAGSSSASSG